MLGLSRGRTEGVVVVVVIWWQGHFRGGAGLFQRYGADGLWWKTEGNSFGGGCGGNNRATLGFFQRCCGDGYGNGDC